MDLILKWIPLNSVVRILAIIREMVNEEYLKYLKESKCKKARKMYEYGNKKIITENIFKKTQEGTTRQIFEKCLEHFANLISNIETKSGGQKRKSFTDGAKRSSPRKRTKRRK